jgi:hypothetical protein
MTPAATLQELIDVVRAESSGADALLQLSQASQTVSDLEQVGDALLGYFVDQCRRSGRSWSEISRALGVSKQAAHKRFTFDIPNVERFTERARAVIGRSEAEARDLGHGFVGTEHLLLALFASTDGLAARLLGEMDITRSKVRMQILTLIKSGTPPDAGQLPFTPRAKAVLRSALHEALQLGHGYVGTEHLLLGLLSDGEAIAAKVLVGLGASYDATRAEIIDRLT